MKQKTDRSFDGIAAKFSRNIYDNSKGKLRQHVLLRDLNELELLRQPCNILDVGAGQGQLALALAKQGHSVHLCDISAEMLQIARQQADAQGLTTASFQQISLSELATSQVQQYRLVLCHAMMEWLAEPQLALAQLKQLVAPAGVLSLMFYNKDAKRFANMVYGNFDYVAADLQVKKKVSLNPQHPLPPAEVSQWCQQAGFTLLGKTGVRCFHDYLREPQLQQSHYEQILALELQYNRTEPYASLGRYQHLLLRAD
ncbi:MAG: methyltransferase domain-containing protein [Gammaproteobacteria bacterium]|nr:methyltransferase domain-containing protein [Gammaproteobacteria bacterium]MBU2181650.1 methyltransferase domain-containing protein [Gammaproteobacteria bacterium]MBU2205362.1 methyltransferase domain-containing protein [Gammaproteobacteria bacterium]